ncbi:MAG: T9SS type A sorting domain-containing protein, partial [Ignavibacteriaceae bacterium]
TWTPHPIATLPGTVQSVSVDIDNDGDLDIISHSNQTNVLLWYENPMWDEHLITSGIKVLNIGPVGDIDQDGYPDVSFSSQNNIGWCKNLGDAVSWKTFMIDTLNNKFPIITGLADIDGDKSLDLTVYIINPPSLVGEVRWYANPYSPTGVKDISNGLPNEFNLSQNYPNPFNPSTIIKYQILEEVRNDNSSGLTSVCLSVFDVLGREVATLVNQKQKPGNYEVTWDASNHPSGVYFYKLQTGDFIQTKKMILLR